jgi:hypothetical protein
LALLPHNPYSIVILRLAQQTKNPLALNTGRRTFVDVLLNLTGGVAQLGAKMGSFDDVVLLTEEAIHLFITSLAKHGIRRIKECLWQFLFTTSAWLELLHLAQGDTLLSVCGCHCKL